MAQPALEPQRRDPGRATVTTASPWDPARWRWPGPALAAWMAGWGLMSALAGLGLPASWALLAGMGPACWVQSRLTGRWRRVIVLLGLPLMLLAAAETSAVAPWAWLAMALLVLGLYPLQAWRDAPVFPTPPGALHALPGVVPLAPGASVLDAGSGLGHGILALRQAYPQARILGLETSLLLVLASRWRLRQHGCGAGPARACQVRQGDMWVAPWAGFALVYLFQRPESMPRAWHKACAEMPAGAWLVSLEFEVPGVAPAARLTCPDGRPLWLYCLAGPEDSSAGPIGR